MPFYTELHAHTMETSCCAEERAETLVQDCLLHGYRTLVVTDHYSHTTFEALDGRAHREKIDVFLCGYRAAKKAAAQTPLTVLPGMELRFTAPGNSNDYLVYGLTEEWLYATEGLLEKSLPQFIPLARAAGLLVYQAHPFRNGMRIVDPGLLDGFEVYNACVRHASRNGIAQQWAQRHGKPGISGSDYHRREDAGRGGIETDAEIRTNDDLLRCLRSGAYRLIRK